MPPEKNNRVQKIEDFLLNPDKVVFESIQEFSEALKVLLPILQGINIDELQTLQGADGVTPQRGVDYFTQEDIDAIEAFILERLPRAGIEYATLQQTIEMVKEEVAKIPRIKGDKGEPGAPGRPGKDGENGSPDTGTDIVSKLRKLSKNQRLKISDIRGLDNLLVEHKESIDELFTQVDRISSMQITIPNQSGGTGGTGTVTSVSVVNANGFTGSVANATTTPAITISTNVTGLLKGDGTALSAAVAGTDYVAPGAITTSGLTMSTAHLLGRTTASTGAIEQISIGSGLSLSAGILSATGGGGGTISGTISTGQVAFGTDTDTIGGENDFFYNATDNRLGLLTNAPTHSLTLGSTATGIALYNTSDQTTNYERVLSAWNSNIYKIRPQAGGTGTVRAIQIGQDSGNLSVASTGITTITNTTNQASNQVLVLQGDRTNPATNDEIYQSFVMSDSAGNQDEFARISTLTSDATSGAEFGRLRFSVAVAGSISSRMELISSALRPASDGLINLGTASNSFGGVFLSSGAALNFANGNSVITHSSGVLNVTTGDLRVTTAGTNSASVVTNAGAQTLTNKTISVDDNTVSGIAASSFVLSNGSGNIDGSAAQKAIPSGAVLGTTDAQTVTSKRIQPRTASSTTASTLTPDLSSANVYFRTTQTATLTIEAPIGTPVIGETIMLYISAAGAQTVNWNATYIPFGAALPTTTVAGKTLMVSAQYNGTNWSTLTAVQI